MTNETKTPHVYVAIATVMGELAKVGIAKDSKNKMQGYNFRGIDDIYKALSSLLSSNQLLLLPKVVDRIQDERASKNGGALFYTTLTVEYQIVSAVDGSQHSCVVMGEAMDSADKSTNKAMSAAFKYLCLQVFCIPTEGDNDADNTTHEVATKSNNNPAGRADQIDQSAHSQVQLISSQQLNGLKALAEGVSDTFWNGYKSYIEERYQRGESGNFEIPVSDHPSLVKMVSKAKKAKAEKIAEEQAAGAA